MFGLDACLCGIAAPLDFAHPPAGQYNSLAGIERGRIRALDSPGKIDPRDVWIPPYHPTDPLQDHAVLVIEGRILDGDGHLACGKPRLVDVFEARRDPAALIVKNKPAKRSHR